MESSILLKAQLKNTLNYLKNADFCLDVIDEKQITENTLNLDPEIIELLKTSVTLINKIQDINSKLNKNTKYRLWCNDTVSFDPSQHIYMRFDINADFNCILHYFCMNFENIMPYTKIIGHLKNNNLIIHEIKQSKVISADYYDKFQRMKEDEYRKSYDIFHENIKYNLNLPDEKFNIISTTIFPSNIIAIEFVGDNIRISKNKLDVTKLSMV